MHCSMPCLQREKLSPGRCTVRLGSPREWRAQRQQPTPPGLGALSSKPHRWGSLEPSPRLTHIPTCPSTVPTVRSVPVPAAARPFQAQAEKPGPHKGIVRESRQQTSGLELRDPPFQVPEADEHPHCARKEWNKTEPVHGGGLCLPPRGQGSSGSPTATG